MTRVRAAVNTALIVVATVSLFLVFTPGGAGMVPVLSVVAGLTLAAFAVQLGGKRGRLLYLSMIVTLFFAFLHSWPIQALLPTYLKTELGYTTDQVTDVVYFAGFGTMAGCWAAGFLGDRIDARKAYALTLLASLAFVYPVFAVRDNLLLLGLLLFVLQATSFGISGLLPRYVGGHFPTGSRGAALGFTYNVGALGGAVAPVLGAHLASGMDLGQALAVLTFAGTVIVVLLVGFDVPARLNRLTDPDAKHDHLAAPLDSESPRQPSTPYARPPCPAHGVPRPSPPHPKKQQVSHAEPVSTADIPTGKPSTGTDPLRCPWSFVGVSRCLPKQDRRRQHTSSGRRTCSA